MRHFEHDGGEYFLYESKYEFTGALALLLYRADGTYLRDLTQNVGYLPDDTVALDRAVARDGQLVASLVGQGVLVPLDESVRTGLCRRARLYRYRG